MIDHFLRNLREILVLILSTVVFIHSCRRVCEKNKICALNNSLDPNYDCWVNLLKCTILGCWLFVSYFPELPHHKEDEYALDSPVDF